MNIIFRSSIFILIFSHFISNAYALEKKHVDIWSDGTRMSRDIFFPESFNSSVSVPAVIMTQGWRGGRQHSGLLNI